MANKLDQKCPVCNTPGVEFLTHEVDIGVGTQVFTVGCDCPKCGSLDFCNTCGGWAGEHAAWCGVDDI